MTLDPTPGPGHDELLDAYVDDGLTGAERERFEQSLDEQPSLQRQLDLQNEIDASLVRTLTPPSEAELGAIVERARAAHDRGGPATVLRAVPQRIRRFALAASLVLFASGMWMIWSIADTGGTAPYRSLPDRLMGEVYADTLSRGFEPDVVCDDGDEFELWFVQHLRRPLRMVEPLPADVEALGLGYCNTLSPATMYLLARVDGTPVVVFIDRASKATDWQPAADSGLRRHAIEVGDLVLYELSPFSAPRLLPHFYDPGGN